MIHFSLILHQNMGMKYAEEPFNMGISFLPKWSFKMGTFLDPKHTHILACLCWSHPHPHLPNSRAHSVTSNVPRILRTHFIVPIRTHDQKMILVHL